MLERNKLMNKLISANEGLKADLKKTKGEVELANKASVSLKQKLDDLKAEQ